MARKIFVSYKHQDWQVAGNADTTARNYVDYIISKLEGDHIYKGEGDEDLSEFKDETIKSHLRDKIYDSSVTIVLISKGMKDLSKTESDQFIPWEIAYSLKEISRNDITSRTNAMLAVVLPDENGRYEYIVTEYHCNYCNVRIWNTGTLFKILNFNMFNKNNPNQRNCLSCSRINHIGNDHSYIHPVKWKDFTQSINNYIDNAVNIQEKQHEYNIKKEIPE